MIHESLYEQNVQTTSRAFVLRPATVLTRTVSLRILSLASVAPWDGRTVQLSSTALSTTTRIINPVLVALHRKEDTAMARSNDVHTFQFQH